MPYPGELAGKTGHSEILSNPDVKDFLSQCANVPEPTPVDFAKLVGGHSPFPVATGTPQVLPELVLAIDGSTYEASIDDRAPSRRVGYVKISSVLLDFEKYRQARTSKRRFVDPLEMNALKKNASALSFALPGSYMFLKQGEAVTSSFRRRIFECFSSDQTKLLGKVSLLDTFHFLSRRAGRAETVKGIEYIEIKHCPGIMKDGSACEEPGILVPTASGVTECPKCGSTVFSTDALRIHEAFVEHGPNVEALNRLMTVAEHILIAHYLHAYSQQALDVFSRLCIVVDGPLAVFGQAAWVHRAVHLTILDVQAKLKAAGHPGLLIMGFQKTGRLREHLDSISHLINDGTFFPVTDDYRYQFVDPGKFGSKKNFGDETYYGQDFMVKMPSGRTFAMLLPYPFDKNTANFRAEKSAVQHYADLPRVLHVVAELESAMYGGAIVPVMLAHGNASISVMPGGKVLDIVSKQAVKGKS
ncbi:MAG: hypothetical protein JHC88_04460 [Niveispirillum sp.]|nr:hypothetical protein [Niveispirillum sp.]